MERRESGKAKNIAAPLEGKVLIRTRQWSCCAAMEHDS